MITKKKKNHKIFFITLFKNRLEHFLMGIGVLLVASSCVHHITHLNATGSIETHKKHLCKLKRHRN